MTIDELREKILFIVKDYPIQKIVLFGSRAAGTNEENSDVDLIIEFSEPVSLLTLSGIRLRLEARLGLAVDIVHGPMTENDLLEIGEEVELYVA